MSLGIECPFCNTNLEMEFYPAGIKGKMGKTVVFCDNDNCHVKPCTDYLRPTEALAEACLFGKIRKTQGKG